MNEAKQRLDEWAKHSPPLAHIVECLKKVMTPEIAGQIMKEGKTANVLWAYIEKQARAQRTKGENGTMFTPPQMEECIYAYLRKDEAEVPPPPAPVENPDKPVKAKAPAKTKVAAPTPPKLVLAVPSKNESIEACEDDGSELDLLSDEELAELDSL